MISVHPLECCTDVALLSVTKNPDDDILTMKRAIRDPLVQAGWLSQVVTAWLVSLLLQIWRSRRKNQWVDKYQAGDRDQCCGHPARVWEPGAGSWKWAGLARNKCVEKYRLDSQKLFKQELSVLQVVEEDVKWIHALTTALVYYVVLLSWICFF